MKEYNINNYKQERWNGFKDYYVKMMYSSDCDPAYPALNYICDRFELNKEQRYWLAFLYGTNYCVPTTYYMFNEFPDFENVDIDRLQNWWNLNKQKMYFQTDRAKVKNFNEFVNCFTSYKNLIKNTQEETFKKLIGEDPYENYEKVYRFSSQIHYFGRFSLFNYLESLKELVGLNILPNNLEFKEAESCRNGMCYVANKDNLVKATLSNNDFLSLQKDLHKLKEELQKENPEIEVTFFNIETVLCAYKKLFWGKRYFGYYIDRQMEEIIKLENNVKEGVDWSVFWQFREEFFNKELLGEKNNWKGIRKWRLNLFNSTNQLFSYFEEMPKIKDYKRRIIFEGGNCYGD